MNKRIVFYYIVFIVCQSIYPQSKLSFIPPTYDITDSLIIDFNKDNIQDFIIVLESNLQDSLEEEYPRILIALQGIDSFNYKMSAINDSLLLCKDCGGFFDPYEGISFDQDTLLITQWGGSSWRWGVEYSCVYDRNDNTWYIVKVHEFAHSNLDPENTLEEKTNYIYKKFNK